MENFIKKRLLNEACLIEKILNGTTLMMEIVLKCLMEKTIKERIVIKEGLMDEYDFRGHVCLMIYQK